MLIKVRINLTKSDYDTFDDYKTMKSEMYHSDTFDNFWQKYQILSQTRRKVKGDRFPVLNLNVSGILISRQGTVPFEAGHIDIN